MNLFLSKQLTDFILARHLSTRSPRSSMFLLICCLLLVKLLQFSNPVKPAQQRTYFCFLYHTFQTTAAQVLAQQYLSEPTEFMREHHLTPEFMLCKYREDTNCEAQASPRAGVCQRASTALAATAVQNHSNALICASHSTLREKWDPFGWLFCRDVSQRTSFRATRY